jgi:hypothetical protein
MCGSATDGCGNVIECGTCAAPYTCGGGGSPNACGIGGQSCGGEGGRSSGPPYPSCETSNPCAGQVVESCTDEANGYTATCCPVPCASDADCGGGEVCTSGACEANGGPQGH